jgi:CRP-like cAMP-binding protein
MQLDSDIELLGQVPLFEGLTGEQLRLLAFSLNRADHETGAVLFREGEAAASAFVVSSGVIELSTGTGDARRVVESCQRGCLIGELALFMETKRRATATVAASASVVELGRPLFRRMLTEYPHVAIRLRDRLASRLRGTVGDMQKVRQALLAIDPLGR